MTPPNSAHRTDFSVRCACGIEYHTSDEHAGRVVPCKCGRNVPLIRPAASVPADAPEESRTHRRKRKTRRSGGAAFNHSYNPSSGETARAANLNWQRRPFHPRSVANMFVRPIVRGSWPERLAASAAWAYLVIACVAWLLLITTSEHAIPGTIIAYGPRWLALWPLVILVPAALIFSRIAIVPLALAALIIVVPIMGARISLSTIGSRALPLTPAAGTFRVVTFNTRGGAPLAADLPAFLDIYKPDVIMLQECGDVLWDALQRQTALHSARHGTLCTASHWPMGDVETMPRDDFSNAAQRSMGGAGLVMRVRFGTPYGPLSVVNLHLETARRGLEGMLGKQGLIRDDPLGLTDEQRSDATDNAEANEEAFENNAAIRNRESQLASRWAVEGSANIPVVIAGDFNLPVESTIFRRYWSRFTDAFEARGNGLGWTKVEGRWLRIRIDHLLTTDSGPKPIRVIVGSGFLSDHKPVIADYAWPGK